MPPQAAAMFIPIEYARALQRYLWPLRLLPCFVHGSEIWLQIQRAHAIKLSNMWCKTQSMSSAIFLCGDSPRSSPMDQSRVRSPGFYVIRTFGYTVYVRKRVFQFLLETWFSASSDDLVLLPLAGRGAWTLILYHCDRAWVGSRLCYLWLATLVKVRTDSYHVRAVSVQKVWRECSGLLA